MAAKDDLSYNTELGKMNVRVAALIQIGNRILTELGYNSAFYVLPGGRVKFGESAEEAVVREIKEELGVDVTVERCLYVHQNFFPWNMQINCHELAFYFLVRAPQSLAEKDNFKTLDGKSLFRWFDKDELKKTDFYPLCIKENLDCLPQSAQVVTERYDADNNRTFKLVK